MTLHGSVLVTGLVKATGDGIALTHPSTRNTGLQVNLTIEQVVKTALCLEEMADCMTSSVSVAFLTCVKIEPDG